jgi:hypothetical protein
MVKKTPPHVCFHSVVFIEQDSKREGEEKEERGERKGREGKKEEERRRGKGWGRRRREGMKDRGGGDKEKGRCEALSGFPHRGGRKGAEPVEERVKD